MKLHSLVTCTLLLVACTPDAPVVSQQHKTVLTRPLLQLDAARATALRIPADAVVTRGGIHGVFVLQDNEARFRMIRPASTQDKQTQVLSGLDGNETLVLGSLQEVHDGSPIKAE